MSDAIHADTYDHGIVLCIFINVALKIVSFDRAARGEVFGLEVKHNPLALEFIERHLRSLLVRQGESGGFVTRRRWLSRIRRDRRKGSQDQDLRKAQKTIS